jgi:hypothetical protein
MAEALGIDTLSADMGPGVAAALLTSERGFADVRHIKPVRRRYRWRSEHPECCRDHSPGRLSAPADSQDAGRGGRVRTAGRRRLDDIHLTCCSRVGIPAVP